MDGRDVRFTRHALERFAARAGVAGTLDELRAELEAFAWHGSVVSEQPPWAHLEPAPAFLVIANWLCMPLRPGERDRIWDATTVITHNDMSWWDAVKAGWLAGPPVWVHIWPVTPAMALEINAKRVAQAAAAARQAAVMREAQQLEAEREARRQAAEAETRRVAAAQAARVKAEVALRNRVAMRAHGWWTTALAAVGTSLALAPLAPGETDGEPGSELVGGLGTGFWCAVFALGLVIVFETGLRKLWSMAAFAVTFAAGVGLGVVVKTTGPEDHIGLMVLCAAAGLLGSLGVRRGITGMARAGTALSAATLVITILVVGIGAA